MKPSGIAFPFAALFGLLVVTMNAGAVPAPDPRPQLQRALERALADNRLHPDQPAVLQRVARGYSDLCDYQPNPEEAQAYARQALEYAEGAARLEPGNAEHALSVAIAYGKLGLWGGAGDKADCARRVYDAARRSESLDPNYAWAHHVLGRWNREVSDLNAAARLWVRWFLGGLPPASKAVAVRELRRATDLDPKEPAHWIELGFAEAACGDCQAARTCWRRGLGLPGNAPYQDEARARAQKALAALSPPG